MKAKFFALALAFLVALPVALGAATNPRTFTGTVGDTMCGAKHEMGGSAADCTRKCANMGSQFALIVDGHVYPLNAGSHAAALGKLAGARATVVGTLEKGSITVASVARAR